MSILEGVASIFASAGVPEYIWKPIMELESGGNPSSTYITGNEYSKGLFQINVLAHPEYRGRDLNNPAVNAQTILELWENRGVLDKARELPIDKQAAYVWKYGSRPLWTGAKEATVTQLSSQYLTSNDKISAAPPASTGDKIKDWLVNLFPNTRFSENLQGYNRTRNPDTGLYELTQKDPETGKEISRVTGNIVEGLSGPQQVVKLGIYGVLVIFGFISLVQAFPVVEEAAKIVKGGK